MPRSIVEERDSWRVWFEGSQEPGGSLPTEANVLRQLAYSIVCWFVEDSDAMVALNAAGDDYEDVVAHWIDATFGPDERSAAAPDA